VVVEVCFLVDAEGGVLWTDRSTSAIALPDSPPRWRAIWAHRDRIAVIAHSHPHGPLAFSDEDRTTMTAIDAGLGRPVRYAVVTIDALLYREADGRLAVAGTEPGWAAELRRASGMHTA
jgi:hypothetical protein